MQRLKNNLSLLFSLTAVVTIIIISISCNDNPVGPGNEPPPGRRDYIITVDTIDVIGEVFKSIWGTSENNMWAVGDGSRDLWHYDGETWTALHPLSGSQNSIYGFSENDIYIASNEGWIHHYNGSTWYEQFRYGPDGNNPNHFTDIWGYSPTDIYACGYFRENKKSYGLIFHYDGKKWERVNIPKIEGQIWQVRGDLNNRQKQYFIINNVDFQPPDSSRIFELSGNNIREIYYGQFYTWERSNPFIETVGGKLYFGFNRKIHSFDGKNFLVEKIIYLENYSNWFNGRSINDLILATVDGFVHYNGSEVKYLYQNENTFLVFDYTITDNSFFAVTEDFDNKLRLIIKGVLDNNME